MTYQQQFEFADPPQPAGEAARDRGMKRATRAADRQSGGDWSERAFQFLQSFGKDRFRLEEVREYAYAKGLERPPSERAWGSVIRRAAKQGIFRKVGHAPVKNPDAHCAIVAVWERADA